MTGVRSAFEPSHKYTTDAVERFFVAVAVNEKVVNVSTSKTGKHGHAKANFTATDIFTGKKLEDVIPSTHTTSVPVVRRNEYQLLDISDDGFCSLLTGEEERGA